MAYEQEQEQEQDTVTLTLEDDTEVECLIWGFVEVDGQRYISLLPMADAEDDQAGCYLYRYDEDADGEPVLETINDDKLLDRVVEAFDHQFSDEEPEYDEIISDDEE